MTYSFRIQYTFDPETGSVCATIPSLNSLSDYGENFEEAEKNITIAAKLYIEEFKEKLKSDISKNGTNILITA